MKDEANNKDLLEELGGDLRAAVERLKRLPVPGTAMQCALDRAACCGTAKVRAGRRLRPKALLGLAAAAAACIALGLWLLQPANLWAEVAQAVQAKPWIHGTRRSAQPGQSSEFWISTAQASGGSRSADEISFIDDRLQISYRYKPQKKVLYRLPASNEALAQGQQFLILFQGLFRGDAKLKTEISGMVLHDQKRTQKEKNGRKWDEYELHFLVPSQTDGGVRMTFVVDAQTHLPQSMTSQYARESVEFMFDYPENGPADIYALGVPKDAQLVDRVPTGDMSRILAGIQAGRDHFDDFHAIVIRYGSPPSLSPLPGRPLPIAYLAWKKGKRRRVEVGIPVSLSDGRFPSKTDEKELVSEACKKAMFTASNVCDGKSVYGGEMLRAGRKGVNFELLAAADRAYSFASEAMNVMPATWCYPLTFNAPNDRTEEAVNAKPSEGPPNTILVTSHVVDLRGHDPVNTFQFQRFWLDPIRGYAVLRHDLLHTDPAVKRPTNQDIQYLMDQWEQTPNGVWYPTRVGTGSLLNELKTGATWYHFFLDFKADMPDELFKPVKRTVWTDRYPVSS